jgi:vacuolar-type H+-ATPase catalytic subunit A/Vma1
MTEELLLAIRTTRDWRLSKSDFTQMVDAPFTNEKKAEWATYRQRLRDITSTFSEATSLEEVIFPTEPEG